MSVQIEKSNTNLIPAMPAPYIPSHGRYEWQKLRSWTGSPEFIRWFDRKPGQGEDGRDLEEMISFSMAIEDEQTMETQWFSVSAYGEDAETLKAYLLDNPQSVFLKAEGVAKLSPCGNYKNIQGRKFVIYEASLGRGAEATPEVQAAHTAQAGEEPPAPSDANYPATITDEAPF